MTIPAWLDHVPLHDLVRVDLALEGAWSETVRPVWTAAEGRLDLPGDELRHPRHRPALELYFDGDWIGLHCYGEVGGEFVFDRSRAEAILTYIEARRATVP